MAKKDKQPLPETKELGLLTLGKALVTAMIKLAPEQAIKARADQDRSKLKDVLSTDIWTTIQGAVERRIADLTARLRGGTQAVELYRALDAYMQINAMIPDGNTALLKPELHGKVRALIKEVLDALDNIRASMETLTGMLDAVEETT